MHVPCRRGDEGSVIGWRNVSAAPLIIHCEARGGIAKNNVNSQLSKGAKGIESCNRNTVRAVSLQEVIFAEKRECVKEQIRSTGADHQGIISAGTSPTQAGTTKSTK